jgi:PPOX class probable F420-dependent enzyme
MRRLVAEARVARLATIDPRGRPHLVPFVFVLDDDTLYSSVDQKPKADRELQRIRNIRTHPEVAVLVDHYVEDWPRLWWVRLRGRGRVIEAGPERDRALLLLAGKYEQYTTAPPPGPAIAVDVEEWRGWSWRPLQ